MQLNSQVYSATSCAWM